jgi:NitT/TauT family transport system ATP-binding protein
MESIPLAGGMPSAVSGQVDAGADRRLPPRSLSLEEFILRLRDAYRSGEPEAVEQALRENTLHRRAVEPYALMEEGRYTRTLVYRDEHLEVIVLGWARGAHAPIHGHDGQQCWMLAVAGELEVMDYRLVAGGERPGYALIERMGPRRTLVPGSMDQRQPETDLHSVRTGVNSDFAISLHVYARPIDSCLVFEPRRSRCVRRQLRYDRVMPVLPNAVAPRREREPEPPRRGWLSSLWHALFRRAQEVKALMVPAHVEEGAAKIAIKQVDHSYANKLVALSNVTLNIRSGEFVCLLGPSGCGKSTLLYALAGHIIPTGGHVFLDGQPITQPGPDRLLMFQEPALFPWMTVRQNLEFVLAAQGVPRAERTARARRFIRYVQLEGFEDTLPHQLSGGMKMRTSLARALAVDAPVMLMDEPFGSLDAQTRLHMHELLQKVWMETRKTIVFVTHDVTEALMLANRVVVMAPRPGRILRDLEVRLPMPREPDDASLARLSREIRAMLRESEALGGSASHTSPRERDTHHEGTAPGTEAALPRGARRGLGAAGALRPLADPSLPEPGERH